MSPDAQIWAGLALLVAGLLAMAVRRPVVAMLGAVVMVAGVLVIFGAVSAAVDQCEARGGHPTRYGCLAPGSLLP